MFAYTVDLLNGWVSKKGISIDGDDPLIQDFIYQLRRLHQKFILTPRDSKRLINSVSFTESSLRGEINIFDIILIEAIRLFIPSLFMFITGNQALLFSEKSNQQRFGMSSSTFEEENIAFTELLTSNEYDSELVKNLMDFLFPFSGLVQNRGMNFRNNEFRDYSMNQRIGIRSYLNRYLNYAIGEQEISDLEFSEILNEFNNQEDFSKLSGSISILESYPVQHIKGRIRLVSEQLSENGLTNLALFYGTSVPYFQSSTIDEKFLNLPITELLEILALIKDKRKVLEILSVIIQQNEDIEKTSYLIVRALDGFKTESEGVKLKIINETEADDLSNLLSEKVLSKPLEERISTSNGETLYATYGIFIEKRGRKEFDECLGKYISVSKENLIVFLKTIINPIYSGFDHVKGYKMMDFKRFGDFEHYISLDKLLPFCKKYFPLYFKPDYKVFDIKQRTLAVDDQLMVAISTYKKVKERNEEE